MDQLARLPLADAAYRSILAAIVSGELAPGERVRDSELAGRLGTSRTPVREALLRLADDGLVEIRPGASSRVAPISPSEADAYEVLAALFALGARLGVPRLHDADLAEMEHLHEVKSAALADDRIVDAIDADDAFHGVPVRASGNRELRRAIDRLLPRVRRLDLLHFARLAPGDASEREHRALLEACHDRDGARAAELTERNILGLGAQVRARLVGGPRP